ncbi:hypothetical protein OG905_38940 [Streptomyces sp. NBC_00322]|uniref:hypothetical protein n=1 Tax=Streptomyces sp. NBC_00322 TaxID=2975712 RepID=UPI002E296881|nr:hypothetical protein [Streptomyces sp. NBC_00322]
MTYRRRASSDRGNLRPCRGLIQHFGYPETLQMTTDGVIRSKYWDTRRYGPRVQEWATQAQVDTTQDTVG